jgi:hypothetical protein
MYQVEKSLTIAIAQRYRTDSFHTPIDEFAQSIREFNPNSSDHLSWDRHADSRCDPQTWKSFSLLKKLADWQSCRHRRVKFESSPTNAAFDCITRKSDWNCLKIKPIVTLSRNALIAKEFGLFLKHYQSLNPIEPSCSTSWNVLRYMSSCLSCSAIWLFSIRVSSGVLIDTDSERSGRNVKELRNDFAEQEDSGYHIQENINGDGHSREFTPCFWKSTLLPDKIYEFVPLRYICPMYSPGEIRDLRFRSSLHKQTLDSRLRQLIQLSGLFKQRNCWSTLSWACQKGWQRI